MLAIIGAFCTQDVPGGHTCSVHSLMRCGFLKSMARLLFLIRTHPCYPTHKQDVSFLPCAPLSTGIKAVDPPFSSSTQRHCGLKFTLSCSFLPVFCIKVGQYFLSFPLSAGPGCLGTCAKTSQLGEYRRGGQRYALEPPPSCMPNLCPVQQCLLCTGLIHAQIQTHKDTNRKKHIFQSTHEHHRVTDVTACLHSMLICAF